MLCMISAIMSSGARRVCAVVSVRPADKSGICGGAPRPREGREHERREDGEADEPQLQPDVEPRVVRVQLHDAVAHDVPA